MDEYDIDGIEFIDERNAHAPGDHRGPKGGGTVMVPVRPVRPGRAVAPVRPLYPRPSGGGRPVVIYQQAPAPKASGLLGNLTPAEIVELAAQGLAAIQPLPLGPVATGEPRIDVENLITYQGALALHAKRDEQLRTLGSLLSKLLSK